jgi:hypothetical protein
MHAHPPEQPVGGKHRKPEPPAPEPLISPEPLAAPVQAKPPPQRPPTELDPVVGKPPPLPEWFATRGPKPGWLATHWASMLAFVGAATLLLNTYVTAGVFANDNPLHGHINEAVAWLTTAALYLQSRQSKVERVAAWRAQVRAEKNPPS